jgi:hypothetical protein
MKKKIFIVLLAVIATVVAWNYPLTEEVNVDGVLLQKKVPYYVRAFGLFYRSWMYKDLANEIVGAEAGDLRKVLAILDWVNGNIMYGVPEGLRTVDDYSYNTVIRQYGTSEQINEVFAMLCLYAGIEAGWDRCYNADKSRTVIFAFAKVDNRWLILDVINRKYFLNREGAVASVSDYLKGDVALSDGESAAYKEYLDDIKEMYRESVSQKGGRALFERLVLEFKNTFMLRQEGARTGKDRGKR